MVSESALIELRKQIDTIDQEILAAMNLRAKLAMEVAKIKMASGENESFYRPEREALVLRKIRETNQGPLANESVVVIFRELMSACLSFEKPLAVAFLGPEGTFTQQAAFKHFGHAITALPLPAIDEVFRAVESGESQYGVVPVENSTEGVITHTLDSFLNSQLLICGEVVLRIHHNLLSKEPDLSGVKEIFSHQQSLAQCRGWLARSLPSAKRTGVSSNGEAAHLAAKTPNCAAIAGDVAAELYGLDILEANIEDEPDNTTRFLVIGKRDAGRSDSDKTTLIVSAGNQPGALYNVLEPFSEHHISMTRIESRPSRRGMWDYVFFIDIEGHRDDQSVSSALASLKQKASMMKILGSYPCAAS